MTETVENLNIGKNQSEANFSSGTTELFGDKDRRYIKMAGPTKTIVVLGASYVGLHVTHKSVLLPLKRCECTNRDELDFYRRH